MRILVIGQGGREHAIAKSLVCDSQVEAVFCCPGNVGMHQDGIQTHPIDALAFEQLSEFAKKEQITFTIVGPEQPLSAGIVDYFQANDQLIFGPTKQAAQLESSKSFAKEIMAQLNIPTAAYQVCTSLESAQAYSRTQSFPIVIKADGLASGKGVFICHTLQEADDVILELFNHLADKVVIEEYLTGEEFTLMAFVDQEKIYPMVMAQDHKQAYDQDKGPNTGGMGAYAPLPQFSECMTTEVITRVMQPVITYLAHQDAPFSGILYAGMMDTKEGIKVIEFNARFGDPEAQVVLPLLKTSLACIIWDLLHHKTPSIQFSNKTSLAVVLARHEYPEQATPKQPLPEFSLPKSQVYYSNVLKEGEQLYTDGGRIFVAQQIGESIDQVREMVYRELEENNWTNLRYRRDIGKRFG